MINTPIVTNTIDEIPVNSTRIIVYLIFLSF